MSGNDDIVFATAMAEYFPHAAGSDGKEIWAKCHKFKLATVKEAIRQHRLDLGAGVFRPDINAVARICWQLEPIANQATERQAREKEDEKMRKDRLELEKQTIDSLTDQEIADWHKYVCDPTRNPMSDLLSKKDPRTSPTLRAMIFEAMRAMRVDGETA